MAISGNLRTMTVPDLLQWLATNRCTGTLVISDGTVDKSIFFRDGMVISSASTIPAEFLGHFLVSHGFITEQQLAIAVERQDIRKTLLGKILTEEGAISTVDLERMLRLKAEETIYDLFSWRDGEFRFLDDELPSYEMVPLTISVTNLMLEGAQRLDEWQQIRQVITSSSAVPVAVTDLLADKSLAEGDRVILEAVNDDRCIEEICLHTHSSEFRVCRTLSRKHQEGKLKLVRPRMVRAEEIPTVTGAAALLAQAQRLLGDGNLEGALRYSQAAISLEPGSRTIRKETKALEEELRHRLLDDGVEAGTVPRLEISMAKLTSASLSPEEGFLLSRINGSSSLAEIIKISPIPELAALLVIWKLLKGGQIRLE